jgi:hypothetical protein
LICAPTGDSDSFQRNEFRRACGSPFGTFANIKIQHHMGVVFLYPICDELRTPLFSNSRRKNVSIVLPIKESWFEVMKLSWNAGVTFINAEKDLISY